MAVIKILYSVSRITSHNTYLLAQESARISRFTFIFHREEKIFILPRHQKDPIFPPSKLESEIQREIQKICYLNIFNHEFYQFPNLQAIGSCISFLSLQHWSLMQRLSLFDCIFKQINPLNSMLVPVYTQYLQQNIPSVRKLNGIK